MNRISALVPDGEHFDSTALNEGIWFTVGHVNNIEAALDANHTSITNLTGERDALQQQLTQAQQDAQTAATKATNDLQSRDEQIQQLQAENTRLRQQPAAEFTATITEQDPAGRHTVASHEDDNNPLNKLADRMFGKPGN